MITLMVYATASPSSSPPSSSILFSSSATIDSSNCTVHSRTMVSNFFPYISSTTPQGCGSLSHTIELRFPMMRHQGIQPHPESHGSHVFHQQAVLDGCAGNIFRRSRMSFSNLLGTTMACRATPSSQAFVQQLSLWLRCCRA